MLAARTVLRRAASLSSFTKWANLPFSLEDYRLPKAPPPNPHPIFEGMEGVDKMIVSCRNPIQQGLVAFGGYGGLRVSETISIEPGWINLDDRKMTVLGKGDKYRVIPISKRLWGVMMPLYVVAKANGSVLVPLEDRNARALVTSIGVRAGIKNPVSSHDLRATFATTVYNKTHNLRLVQYLLGHASVATTQAYLGIAEKEAKAGVEFDDD